MGRLSLLHGDYAAASKFFEEATYSAVNYPDCGVLEEAFRYGLVAHLAANRKGMFAPLEAALQWKDTRNLRQFRASLLLLAAENYAVLGDARQAAKTLDGFARRAGRPGEAPAPGRERPRPKSP